MKVTTKIHAGGGGLCGAKVLEEKVATSQPFLQAARAWGETGESDTQGRPGRRVEKCAHIHLFFDTSTYEDSFGTNEARLN